MTRKPPSPTDLHQPKGESEKDVCRYCLELVDDSSEHYQNCGKRDQLTEIKVTDEFGIVVPQKSGYLWVTKTDAFANRHVNIQGTYIPLGRITKTNIVTQDTEFPIDLSKLNLNQFDNAQEIRRLIETGVRHSTEYDYGPVDLGRKLVEERLDGVYEKDEQVREEKLSTRDERIQAVWEEINDELPFTYERVAAPEGYPRTREGMRWINVTGHNDPDFADTEREKLMFRKPWVEQLIDHGPVALYYPNSD